MSDYLRDRAAALTAAEPVELIDEGEPDAGYLRAARKHIAAGSWWQRLLRRRKPVYPHTFGG